MTRCTGSQKFSNCIHYANSTHLLCAVNPTHKRGQEFKSWELDALPPGDYRNHIIVVPWENPQSLSLWAS